MAWLIGLHQPIFSGLFWMTQFFFFGKSECGATWQTEPFMPRSCQIMISKERVMHMSLGARIEVQWRGFVKTALNFQVS
jgi:hypothetical protein